jgi:hypothetical protein
VVAGGGGGGTGVVVVAVVVVQDPAYASVGPRAEPQARGTSRRSAERMRLMRRSGAWMEDGKGREGAGKRGDGERIALGGAGGTLGKD